MNGIVPDLPFCAYLREIVGRAGPVASPGPLWDSALSRRHGFGLVSVSPTQARGSTMFIAVC